MTNDELANEIEKYLELKHGDYLSPYYPRTEWQQIITALRRGPERPPSGEMVDGTIIKTRSCPNCKEGWLSAAEASKEAK